MKEQLTQMALYFASINSGSNGNCYYVGNDKDAVIVDAGLSCREIERRMNRLSLDLAKVRGVFVSHEHTDHIRGVETLVNKYNLPLFISKDTFNFSRLKVKKERVVYIEPNSPIVLGSLQIFPFTKMHDAADPYSFTISSLDKTVGVFTDIGTVCDNLIHHFKQCHAAFLEANYDDLMLDNGGYPYHLKMRIKGEKGHLSNEQALELFSKHKHSKLSHLILSHLSKNNNNTDLVYNLFTSALVANGVEIVVASRFEESVLYSISTPIPHKNEASSKPKQLMLW